MEYKFIYENSRKEKIKIFLSALLFVIILLALSSFISLYWSEIYSRIPFFSNFLGDLTNVGLSKLFYIGLFGGLFFIPGPLEVAFYVGLTQGNSMLFSFLTIIFSYYLSQIVNYFIGFRLSNIVLNLISKKRVYQARRYVNEYGSYAIFFLNIIPGPAQLLTFALGITKYNFTRLSILTILGNLIRYAVIIGVFALFR